MARDERRQQQRRGGDRPVGYVATRHAPLERAAEAFGRYSQAVFERSGP